jgi:DNA-binding response OmpR family regulator
MRILLVEDDKHLAEMYARKFSVENWITFICNDGGEALAKAREVDPNVIILDLMLPGISGIDVLQILRTDEMTVKIPVIVYTNYGDAYNREKCLVSGADEFVLKVDSTPEELTRVIKNTRILKEIESMGKN